MIHFIRLTRPINLMVIAITMYGFGWYLEEQIVEAKEIGIHTFEFFLLVLSTVLIAAAGNIINDYFDVRADRINKPEKLIIGKYVKKRVAIVTHWAINFIAFGMAVYLSYKLNTFWYVFIHLLSINILWYYSTYFKRKFLIGNILIAGLTAMVPLLVGLYYYLHHDVVWSSGNDLFPFHFNKAANLIVYLSIALGAFAFILNLAREIIKDVQDVDGDLVLKAKTIPIVLGEMNSMIILIIILLISSAGILSVQYLFPATDVKAYYPLYFALLFVFCALTYSVNGVMQMNKTKAKRINFCLKLAMIFGTLSPVWWQILKHYG